MHGGFILQRRTANRFPRGLAPELAFPGLALMDPTSGIRHDALHLGKRYYAAGYYRWLDA
jgi:hypothetical protein